MRAHWSGRKPLTFLPSNQIFPLLGWAYPAMQLNIVVFPAPFGPINPTICPVSISNEMSSLAQIPPKYLDTFSTRRRVMHFSLPAGSGVLQYAWIGSYEPIQQLQTDNR